MEEINLGAKVQEFRNMRQYSLRELAARAELTPSMLSQIENNSANPSINTLKSIAAALEVPMFKFFQTNAISEELIVRKGNYIKLGSVRDGVIYDLLTPDLSGSIEFCLMEIPPKSVTSVEEKSHVGEEVAYVISGDAVIHLDGKKFELSQGDCVKIPPGVKHLWENVKDMVARVIFAITPPSF
ncbi:MAG TPA: cupin domain-containing protein [Candidatus Blautia gallistercoris]|uniref:Cupin domain-containing protein n=1 Tax=Candidatus Blautia gallistercoris TaxID=2838490 RepID=A0A9D1WJ02_9FIRM|nr:cupin domain-containing protein [Candidatus Blautia gallistercoris]